MCMDKTYFYIKLMSLFAMATIASCSNNQNDKQAPDSTKAAAMAITDSAGIKKSDAANMPDHSANRNEEKKITNTKTKKTEKNTAVRDTSASLKSAMAPVSKKENAAADATVSNQSAAKPTNTDAVNKPFVSKYGIIPRDANENNLTVFFNTFPDKNTLIRVNFDGPADAEMNSVKTQIIKVLKKSGYVNVSDHSETIEPKRMPKDIHYELQHDGSVVFWVPIANQE